MSTYKIHLHKEEEGGFTAIVPSLPGCIIYCKNVDEAILTANEAIELYIEEQRERGGSIPDNGSQFEFEIMQEATSPYNQQFVAIVLKGDQDKKEGKGRAVTLDDIEQLA